MTTGPWLRPRGRVALRLASAALALSMAACAPDPETALVERGAAVFSSKELSSSRLNLYTCATCHTTVDSEPDDLLRTGAPLDGVVSRPSYWAGNEIDLLRAVNQCRSSFMVEPTPLEASDQQAAALYAYLESLPPTKTDEVPFTVIETIGVGIVPRGSVASGQDLYRRACGYCHGTAHEGVGRLGGRVPVLPEDTIAAHEGYAPGVLRLVFIEKVRHGAFLNYGGDMPPFSAEVLSDQELGDLLEALGITGEGS